MGQEIRKQPGQKLGRNSTRAIFIYKLWGLFRLSGDDLRVSGRTPRRYRMLKTNYTCTPFELCLPRGGEGGRRS